ncbi:putative abc transporter cdr4 protein [Neofusicoccum parvum UCRNP2]|uniref:Putative abc transporter cdr4 protein n=1 Tax=Botryosphaeria parva (strain UCR-NP2) TaxID=1287680 RepID=R1GL39_BOTPV|nr:putative abc transporter cdr4 protein [Neofusicoccum parvum UCRNP2]
MHREFRGDAIYTAELDVHFPSLTVGDTLLFAARARAPRLLVGGVEDREVWACHMRDVVMAMFGIGHTLNTKVGNDYVRGVSGGERKRVSIAEATLSRAPLQCWDNSTRGLDSANALEFCRTLRVQTEYLGVSACVAIYQASQGIYDVFDKVTVLYDGRQIFFGRCEDAKDYFVDMGFECPQRQTTADFLTSMTSPAERIVREGYENRVPRMADEFAAVWKASDEYHRLLQDLREYDKKYSFGGKYLDRFVASKKAQQAKLARTKSPYTLSYGQQVRLCLWRCIKRLRADPSLTLTQFFGNAIMALIIGSVFYNLKDDTESFFRRGAVLFFAILMNAFGSALEILTLYAQRPIVEKHTRYALYHPSAEAIASMLTDIPYKIANCIIFNLALYFLTNLRREPSAFFFFLLISFALTLAMSMLFRTIASVSRTISQAMVPATLLILAIVIFAGFAIPIAYMRGWCRWINFIDPVAYGFEALMVNEFHGRAFACDAFVPGYPDAAPQNRVCNAVGASPGASAVDGDAYVRAAFGYEYAHRWRDLGAVVGFTFLFMATYLVATEFIQEKRPKGEVLVFRRGHGPGRPRGLNDIEMASRQRGSIIGDPGAAAAIKKQTSIFHWQSLCYDIKSADGQKRLLDNVDGWIKPGTLTALMGVSGAGKTTLLDTLAARTTMGVVTGDVLVDGLPRNANFQRSTGYVQQQDIHLETSTVREALNFSALLRQPATVSRQEKIDYAWEVIKLLEMEEYADAVVGVPGQGLNVEQRRRLTIGVELAAKPALLFLDEPTSGLDSQTSWAICDLIEKLTKAGQAVLCTIHQPSAMLFERFDRLLLLHNGGKTIYFGDIGENSRTVIKYFEERCEEGRRCPEKANPAEWLLEVIGAAPGCSSEVDWAQVWRDSQEHDAVYQELVQLKEKPVGLRADNAVSGEVEEYREFAAPFSTQMREVTKRVFQQYWRTPTYIYSKFSTCLFSSLFIGLVFLSTPPTIQGLQNSMFAIFMLITILGQLIQQSMPLFITQRTLYEARERPSRTYAWPPFLLATILADLPYSTLATLLIHPPIFYLLGLQSHASAAARSGQLLALVWAALAFASTFSAAAVAAAPTAEAGANAAQLCFSLCLVFCGVLPPAPLLPTAWRWLNRVSPFTYLVEALLSAAVGGAAVTCAEDELLRFEPPEGVACAEYMEVWIRGVVISVDCISVQLRRTIKLLARFDSVTKRESPQLISNEYLKKLDGCYLRFRDWGDGVGVGDGALDVVERSGSSFKKSLVKSFDGIYIRLRVVGNLLKEGKELSGERDEEARAIVLRISADVDALEEQVPALKAFLENPDGLHADGDAAARHRQVSSSTANTRDTSTTWTTNTTADDEAYDSPPAPLRSSAPPLTPKTPRTQTFQAFIGSDRTDTTAPTTATTTTSPGTTAPDWDDSGQWEDRDYVIRALSASQSQTSFAAASDDEDGPDAVFAPRKMLDFSSSSKSGDGTSSDSPTAVAAVATAADSSPRHAANTTWIEDNSSTFKEGGSEESPKGAGEAAAAAAAAEKSKRAPRAKAVDGSPSSGGELKAWEKDHDQFRKYIGARLGMLERHNRSLERRLEDLQGRGLDGDEARGVIEEFVKRKGEEERWEKSIREAAIEEYKEHVRLEAERERERRNVLMHQARLIEDRAQQEMSEIYQHTGVQIREAEQRHQDEVYQIQQRLTSELLVIERRIHEQIESSMWSASPNRAESAKKGKGPQVSFEARETTPRVAPWDSRGNSGNTLETVHKNQISPDTLTYYGLPWEWDKADRDAVVILKDMEPWETNILFEHSRRKRLSAARAPHNSAVDDDDDETDTPPPPLRRRSNSRHLEEVGREIGERVRKFEPEL